MIQAIPMTDKEQLAMYLKLTKKELAKMLIEANKALCGRLPIVTHPPFPLDSLSNANYFERCPCNPKNGGSGVCGCTLNNPVTYTTSK